MTRRTVYLAAILFLTLLTAAVAGVNVTRTQFILADSGERFDTEAECVARATATLAGSPRDCIAKAVVVGSCADVPEPTGFVSELRTTECPDGSPSAYRLDETYLAATDFPKCHKVAIRLLWACSWKEPAPPKPEELTALDPVSTDAPPADWTPMPPTPLCPPDEAGSPPNCKKVP